MPTETQPNPPSPEVLLFKEFAKLLETNPNLKFTVSGIGNILANPGGDTAGRKLVQYDNVKKIFIENSNISGNFERPIYDKNELLPLFKKVVFNITLNDVIYLGFKENVRGQENSKFFHDTRTGNIFFAGFKGNVGEGLYSEQEAKILMEVLSISKEKPDVFIQMMEALCNRYIPQYYNEIKRIEKESNAGIKN